MPQPFDELKKVRLEKLRKLKDLKINPFVQPELEGRKKVEEVKSQSLASPALVAGRIRATRTHGGSTFVDLYDETGKLQLFFSREKLGQEKYSLLDLFDLGDFIQAVGTLFKTEAGELTLQVSDYQFLAKSLRSLPSSFFGLKDVEERYRQRYVDLLLNPEVKETLLIRGKFIKLLREYLDKNGFVEVETPVLQPIYGGATARPFITHHNALDADFYLRISDELYLKRLIVGGFEKVYEIGKDFRNEGLERGRNPEFTQLEFYWAYATYEDLMRFSEEMLSSVIKKIKGTLKFEYEGKTLDFTPPWKRTTYRDLVYREAGIDVDKVKSEKDLLGEIKKKKISLDLAGIAGYGAWLDALYKRVVRPKVLGPIFLTDRPVEMVPLAKRKEDEPAKVATFQLVAVGEEFINAYNELNDPIDQKARWEEEMKLAQKEPGEHQVLDEDYIRALEYGMPPTAGWGLGIDRFVMLLTGATNIKEVIAFPTLRPEK